MIQRKFTVIACLAPAAVGAAGYPGGGGLPEARVGMFLSRP